MNLPMLPQDKANHAIYGAVIALVVQTLVALAHINVGFLRPSDVGLIAAVLFGGAKEGVDAWQNYRATGNFRTGPHGVEPSDAVATFCGGLLVWLS